MSLLTRVKRWYRVGLDWDAFLGEVKAVVRPGDVLLDAGAGECKWAEHFPEAHYIGLDAKVGDETWNFDRVQIEADLNEGIPLEDHSVDVVISIQVLEHLSNPQTALREIARVLKPGGHVFLTTPFSQAEHQVPHDYFRYTRYGLKYLVETAGLEMICIRPMGGYFLLMREHLTHLHAARYYEANRFLRILSWLPRQLVRILTVLILPPLFYALDHLDNEAKLTLGFVTHARKPL